MVLFWLYWILHMVLACTSSNWWSACYFLMLITRGHQFYGPRFIQLYCSRLRYPYVSNEKKKTNWNLKDNWHIIYVIFDNSKWLFISYFYSIRKLIFKLTLGTCFSLQTLYFSVCCHSLFNTLRLVTAKPDFPIISNEFKAPSQGYINNEE